MKHDFVICLNDRFSLFSFPLLCLDIKTNFDSANLTFAPLSLTLLKVIYALACGRRWPEEPEQWTGNRYFIFLLPSPLASCKMPRSPRLAHKAPNMEARAASLVSVSSVVAAAAVSSTYPVATAVAAQ